jgi:PAS domain S-box-containing protein
VSSLRDPGRSDSAIDRIGPDTRRRVLETGRVAWWTRDSATGRVAWSENFAEILGIPASSLDHSFQSLLATVHPDDRASLRAAVARTAETGEPFDLDFRVVPPDGTIQALIARGRLGMEEEQSVLTGVVVNVTARRAAERERALLAAIVDSSDDAIVSKDLHGRILSWNGAAERLFGYTAAEAIGRPITILLPPERADDFFSIMDRIRRGERVEHYETLRRRKDGTILEVALTISPIHDATGTVIGASKIARDIGPLKAAERERQRMRELFLGILGHDLRNPLNTIAASVYAIRSELPESADRVVPRITRATDRMSRMIEQLLDFTRARLGEGIPVEPRAGDLRQICLQVVEDLGAQHPGRIRFSAPESLTGTWDGDRLIQAISNLVSNAVQHGSKVDPVEVRLRREGADAVLDIVNRGDPIAPEAATTIFEPFRRLGAEPGRESAGLGLGLYIAREVVRAHGGTIELDSNTERTRFRVRLPLTQPEALPS